MPRDVLLNLIVDFYVESETERQHAKAMMAKPTKQPEEAADDSDYEELLDMVQEGHNKGDPDVKQEKERIKMKKRILKRLLKQNMLAPRRSRKQKQRRKQKRHYLASGNNKDTEHSLLLLQLLQLHLHPLSLSLKPGDLFIAPERFSVLELGSELQHTIVLRKKKAISDHQVLCQFLNLPLGSSKPSHVKRSNCESSGQQP